MTESLIFLPDGDAKNLRAFGVFSADRHAGGRILKTMYGINGS